MTSIPRTRKAASTALPQNLPQMKIKDMVPEERPRERMHTVGARNMTGTELLALVVRSGTKGHSAIQISKELYRFSGNSLARLANMAPRSLMRVDGVGEATAACVLAAFELGRQAMIECAVTQGPVTSGHHIYTYMAPYLAGLDHEECWFVYLGTGMIVTGCEKLSEGSHLSTNLDIKEAVLAALAHKAHRVVLVHNHTSGNVKPSPEDVETTEILAKALKEVGIPLVDHVIFHTARFFSFAADGSTELVTLAYDDGSGPDPEGNIDLSSVKRCSEQRKEVDGES